MKADRAASASRIHRPISPGQSSARDVSTRNTLFVSYCSDDIEWMHLFHMMLSPELGGRGLEWWADTAIDAGDEWRKEIGDAVVRSRVALLLVSARFLASPFIRDYELPALQAAEVRLLPVLIGSCFWEHVDVLERVQWLNDPRDGALDLVADKRGERDRRIWQACKKLLVHLPEPERPTSQARPSIPPEPGLAFEAPEDSSSQVRDGAGQPAGPELDISSLEVGDWHHVARGRDQGAGAVDDGRLQLAHELVAESMRLQALDGRVSEAWDRLGEAARLLPSTLTHQSPHHGEHSVLTAAPMQASDVAELVWRTTRLIWREQQELDDLRRRITPCTSPAEALVGAFVEYLRWVEFDWQAWALVNQVGAGSDLKEPRADLLERATRLRRFADPAAADVGASTWRVVGGYRGLRSAALDRLAETAVEPWTSIPSMDGDVPARRASSVPVRKARLSAWKHAQRFRKERK